jgi:hypothetical protein
MELVLILAVFSVVFLIPGIFYALTLQRLLERCAPASRAMSPGLVWLLLIPLFNLVWHFVVVTNVARSLRGEFVARGIPLPEAEPGKSLGIAMCALAASSWIPLLGFVTGLAGFVCWIVYWVKMADFSRQLSMPAGMIRGGPTPYLPGRPGS